MRIKAAKPASDAEPAERCNVGAHLRAERRNRDLYQRDVAMALRVKLPTYQAWEGGAEPTVRFWPAIVEWLGFYPEPDPFTFAERLVAYRRSQGLTQTTLAKQLGVDPGSVRRWEQGGKVRKTRDRESLGRHGLIGRTPVG